MAANRNRKKRKKKTLLRYRLAASKFSSNLLCKQSRMLLFGKRRGRGKKKKKKSNENVRWSIFGGGGRGVVAVAPLARDDRDVRQRFPFQKCRNADVKYRAASSVLQLPPHLFSAEAAVLHFSRRLLVERERFSSWRASSGVAMIAMIARGSRCFIHFYVASTCSEKIRKTVWTLSQDGNLGKLDS